MKKDNGESYLCAAMQQLELRNREQSYVVVVVLKPGYIDQLMEREKADSGGIILMFDQNGEILLSNDKQGEEWQLTGYSGADTPYEIQNNQKKYMIQVQESDVMDGYYASAIPFDYFWKQLFQLRTICGISIVVCCIVSVLIAYRNTLRTYRPVEKVVNRLSEQADIDYDEKIHTEFEYVTYLFERREDEWKEMQKKLRKSENLSRDRFLMSLMEGTAQAELEESGELQKNGILFCSGRFWVAALQVKTEDKTELLSFIIRNVFEELCNRKHRGYVITNFGMRYLVLMNPGETVGLEELEQILEEGRYFLNQYYKLDMSIAVSDIHEGIDAIPGAYDEAIKALRYRYLLGNKHIIEYRQIKNREFCYSSSGESKLSNMVKAYIGGQSEQKNADLFMKEIFFMQKINQEASMETVECFQFEFSNAVSRAMISMGYTSEERGAMVKGMLSEPTLELFRQRCVFLLEELCKKEQEKMYQKDICELIKRCIEEHFSEPDLSIAMVGEYIGLSGAYLARMFRTRYGISMLNYISEIRVNQAKKVLLETKKSIKEIAEENGFLSSNVFIKAFKKQEGVTPGAFRELKGQKTQI